jgi:hypothetical protein
MITAVKPSLPPARRQSDDELVRTDVFYAVSAAFAAIESENAVIRNLAMMGKLDDRCTSRPVLVGAL